MLASPLKLCMPPAACQVEPEVNSPSPAAARWSSRSWRGDRAHWRDHPATDDHGSRGRLHGDSSPDSTATVTSARTRARRASPWRQAIRASWPRGARGREQQQPRGQHREDDRHLRHDGGGSASWREDLRIQIQATGPGEHVPDLRLRRGATPPGPMTSQSRRRPRAHAACRAPRSRLSAPAGQGAASAPGGRKARVDLSPPHPSQHRQLEAPGARDVSRARARARGGLRSRPYPPRRMRAGCRTQARTRRFSGSSM